MCNLHRYFEDMVSRVWKASCSNTLLDSQSDSELDTAVANEYRDVATAAGRPFLPVCLRVSREENTRRVAMPSRLTSGARKLVDPKVLLAMLDSCNLFEFSDVKSLHLEATELDAEESATKVLHFIVHTSDEVIDK
jgi:hypothetical protein